MSNKIPKEGNFKSLIFGGVTAFMAAISMLIFSIFTAHKLIFPVAPTSAETSYATSSEVGLNVKESIKIAVDKSSLALEDSSGNTQIAPEASGTLITGDVNVAVTTNAYGGYRLGIYTADSTTNMTHSNTSVSSAISSISTATGYDATNGLATLPGNTWGFRKYTEATNNSGEGGTPASWSNWYGVGSSSSNMAIVDTKDVANSTYCDNLSQPVNESGCTSGSYDTYKIGFGANLTFSLPAGNYTNNIIFSAVTNEATTFLTFSPNVPASVTVTGSMAPKTILKGSTTTLPNDTTFRREGLGVKGWALTSEATEVSTITQPDLENPGSDPEHPNTTTVSLIPGATIDVDSLISAAGIPSSTTGPIPLYAVWDNAYNINYVANNPEGTTVTGTMNPSTSVLGLDTTIPSTTYEIEGYNLIGWAFTSDATEPASISASGAKDLVSGATFTTQQLITAAAAAGQSVSTSNPGNITLYAIWEQNLLYMQDALACSSISTNNTNINDNVGVLKDSRDNQRYTVYRFPNTGTAGTNYPTGLGGYCIMTQDLSLGMVDGPNASGEDTTRSQVVRGGNMVLRSSDSNFDSTYASGSSWGINYVDSVNNGSGWSSTDSEINKQYTVGPKAGNEAVSTHGYYSWGAALVSCPKGWRLPTSTEYSSIASFMGSGATGSATIRSAPYNFIYGGRMKSGSIAAAGVYSYYWSSTQYSSTISYGLYLENSGQYIGSGDNQKNQGFAVRCIAEAADGTMQSFDASTLAVNQTAKLMDERDGSIYTVKKFGTGNNAEVWMTSNLKLGYDKGYTLTSADTNIPDSTTYYIPKAGYRGSVTSSSTLTSTDTATFDSNNESQAHVQYRAEGQGGDQSSSGTLAQSTGYYNFWAASLGYSGYQTGTSSGNTPRDICPKGWQLPRGSSTSTYSFYWLDTVAFGGSGSNRTDTTTRDKYLNQASFLYSGSYYSSQLYNVGSYGFWWSSTVNNTDYSYRLYLDYSGYVYPQNYGDKYLGFAVRCVAK